MNLIAFARRSLSPPDHGADVGAGGAEPSLSSDPTPEIRSGLVVLVGFSALLLSWATVVRLDAAAHGSGRVTVEGQRRQVQHKDGGIVGALRVREGQSVRAGQVLLELAAADVLAQERSLTTQVITLKAQQTRLEAEVSRSAEVRWPAEFTSYTGEDKLLAEQAMQVQQAQFTSRAESLRSTRNVLSQRQSQMHARLRGFDEQLVSANRQKQLLEDQLNGTETLRRKGFASVNTVRALERTQAQIDGSKAELASSAASVREQIGELGMQAIQADRQYAEQAAAALNETLFQLNDLTPKLQAARDQLARVAVRAPVSGKVVGLSVFTVGGVIAPGAKLMEIVPEQAPLVVQAALDPAKIDGVRIGQPAEVRFVSMRDKTLPIVLGRLSNLSADTLTDERTGSRYYNAEIVVPPEQLALLTRGRELGGGLQPGLPVEVMIPLRKRTALQYLLEPLTGPFWRSFREQ